jgi:hypothetical protein
MDLSARGLLVSLSLVGALRRGGYPIELSIGRCPRKINGFFAYLAVIGRTHETDCEVLWLVKNTQQQLRRGLVG